MTAAAPVADTAETFREWCVIELLGRRRLAGMVTEQTIAGVGFLRLDVPAHGVVAAATQFVAPGSVYALTPCSEETARLCLESVDAVGPVSKWEVPRLAAPEPVVDEYVDDDAEPPF